LGDGQYDSFLVRVLSRTHAGKVMHGEVTHVATLNRARFTNLGQLTAFIRSNIGRRPGETEPD
jgi:hypothetical protein